MAGKSKYRGVAIRGNSVQINFRWRGKTRKATLAGLPPNAKGERQAFAIREIIKNEIENGQFKWSHHFPDHPLAKAETEVKDDYTVAELLNDWLTDQKGVISPHYDHNSKWRIDNVLIPAFGHLPLSMLNSGHIRKWARALSVTRDTIKNYLAPLRSAIREALADNKITQNPIHDLILPKEKISVTKRIEQAREKIDPFNQEEAGRISACPKTPKHLKTVACNPI